jgi:hypothetical protein
MSRSNFSSLGPKPRGVIAGKAEQEALVMIMEACSYLMEEKLYEPQFYDLVLKHIRAVVQWGHHLKQIIDAHAIDSYVNRKTKIGTAVIRQVLV